MFGPDIWTEDTSIAFSSHFFIQMTEKEKVEYELLTYKV